MIYILYTLLVLVILIPLTSNFIPDMLSKFIFVNISTLFSKDKYERKRRKEVAKIICDSKMPTDEFAEKIYSLYEEEKNRKKNI